MQKTYESNNLIENKRLKKLTQKKNNILAVFEQ